MPSILIYERSGWYTATLRQYWPGTPIHIHFRTHPTAFLETCRETPADLLLIDLENRPEAGWQILKSLASQAVLNRTVLLVETAQREIGPELQQLGCLLILQKPVTVHRLTSVCQQILRRQKQFS